jgi:hypothetical protein
VVSCGYADIVQKIVNKGADVVTAKDENGDVHTQLMCHIVREAAEETQRNTHRVRERERETHTHESLKTTKHTNQPNGKQTNKQANSWKLEPATIVQGSWSRGCRDGSQISCSRGERRREQGSKEKPNFQGEL